MLDVLCDRVGAERAGIRRRRPGTKAEHIEQSSFGNGTGQVGSDITPGVYRAAGGTTCYWAILNSTDTFDIATNG
jgi:hypothetical protein